MWPDHQAIEERKELITETLITGAMMAIRWEKLTVKSQEAMQQAQGRATELGNPEIQPVHLLLALIEDREGVIPAVLEKIGVPTERLESNLHQVEEKLPRVQGSTAQPGPSKR